MRWVFLNQALSINTELYEWISHFCDWWYPSIKAVREPANTAEEFYEVQVNGDLVLALPKGLV